MDVSTLVPLLHDAAYYHKQNGSAGYPNIDAAVLDQLMAECAQDAVNQGFDLNNYAVMVASVFMPGLFVRAWGGWSQSNFAYDDGAGTAINITTNHPLGLIAQRHDADWGRAAHEFGHNLIDGGLVLGEDVYASDLVDPSEATAHNFEMMGNPTGNSDAPRPLEINRFEARIRNDGTADATNVKVTHYAIQPPGVGDNGNWALLATYTLALIPAGGSAVGRVNWVPLVGEHTCLKVAISQQLGEVTGGNTPLRKMCLPSNPQPRRSLHQSS